MSPKARHTSIRRDPLIKNSNKSLGEIGSHTEATAHKIKPRGSRGSFKFFLEATLMFSPIFLWTLVHVWLLEAPMA